MHASTWIQRREQKNNQLIQFDHGLWTSLQRWAVSLKLSSRDLPSMREKYNYLHKIFKPKLAGSYYIDQLSCSEQYYLSGNNPCDVM